MHQDPEQDRERKIAGRAAILTALKTDPPGTEIPKSPSPVSVTAFSVEPASLGRMMAVYNAMYVVGKLSDKDQDARLEGRTPR